MKDVAGEEQDSEVTPLKTVRSIKLAHGIHLQAQGILQNSNVHENPNVKKRLKMTGHMFVYNFHTHGYTQVQTDVRQKLRGNIITKKHNTVYKHLAIPKSNHPDIHTLAPLIP